MDAKTAKVVLNKAPAAAMILAGSNGDDVEFSVAFVGLEDIKVEIR